MEKFNILLFIQKAIGKIRYVFQSLYMHIEKTKLGYCGKHVQVKYPVHLNNNIYLDDYVCIKEGTRFIMNATEEKFIMRKRAGAAQGLTVITGKHGHIIGHWGFDVIRFKEKDTGSTVIVEEDVRIGANVTLLPNVTIGRGAQIGACSVVTKDIPPYAIAAGNPAKVIKFIFTPEEILQHESILYKPDERLSKEYIIAIQSTYANLKSNETYD